MQTLKQQLAARQHAMRQYWQQLPSKDQQALTLLGIFVGLLLAIYGVLLPSFEFQQRSKNSYREQTDLLHWLEQQAPLIAGLATEENKRTGSTLSQINQAAKQHSLTIQRIQPQADDSIKVWLENAAFDKSMQWLETLSGEGVSLRELNISKVSSGLINFRGTFNRQKSGNI